MRMCMCVCVCLKLQSHSISIFYAQLSENYKITLPERPCAERNPSARPNSCSPRCGHHPYYVVAAAVKLLEFSRGCHGDPKFTRRTSAGCFELCMYIPTTTYTHIMYFKVATMLPVPHRRGVGRVGVLA